MPGSDSLHSIIAREIVKMKCVPATRLLARIIKDRQHEGRQLASRSHRGHNRISHARNVALTHSLLRHNTGVFGNRRARPLPSAPGTIAEMDEHALMKARSANPSSIRNRGPELGLTQLLEHIPSYRELDRRHESPWVMRWNRPGDTPGRERA